jgi:hypothetical protein
MWTGLRQKRTHPLHRLQHQVSVSDRLTPIASVFFNKVNINPFNVTTYPSLLPPLPSATTNSPSHCHHSLHRFTTKPFHKITTTPLQITHYPLQFYSLTPFLTAITYSHRSLKHCYTSHHAIKHHKPTATANWLRRPNSPFSHVVLHMFHIHIRQKSGE